MYLPDRWFGGDYALRRKACGIPTDLRFQPEPEIALAMLAEIVAAGHLPFRWVTADEHFGENPAFLDGIAATGQWYQVEVPSNTRVGVRTPAVQPPGPGLMGRPRLYPRVAPDAPRPVELKALAAQSPRTAWHQRTIKEGSRGPPESDFAFVRVTAVRDSLPRPRLWVTFRRSLTDPTQVKYFLSNAPACCPKTELVGVTGLRWPIETALEEGKGEIGQDHYGTRSWLGWHHHMLQSFLANFFLMRLRWGFKKTRPSPWPRRASLWPVPSSSTATTHATSARCSITASGAIMPPTARSASARSFDISTSAKIAVCPKSRSNEPKSRSHVKSRSHIRKQDAPRY